MLQTLRFDQNAPWKQRFRAPAILWTQLAAANKTRGIVASTRSGTAQIYAWDVPSGSLRQVTRSEEHTSELQSRRELVCRLLLEKKKKKTITIDSLEKKKNMKN